MNRLKIGVILSYAQLFLGMLVSLLYTPLMLNYLSQIEYGL